MILLNMKMKLKMHRILLLLPIGLTACVNYSAYQNEKQIPTISQTSSETLTNLAKDEHMNKEMELQAIGKELRTVLNDALQDSKKNITGVHGYDLTSDISKYLYPGQTFDDAEKILKYAGLNVSQRISKVPPNTDLGRVAVFGRITLSTGFLSSRRIVIALTPQSFEDYSKVARVSGSLITPSL